MPSHLTYRSLEDLANSHAGAVELEHVLLEDEVVSPQVLDVGLESRSERTKIVEAGDTSVDLEALGVEELPLEEVVALESLVLLHEVDWLVALVGLSLVLLIRLLLLTIELVRNE